MPRERVVMLSPPTPARRLFRAYIDESGDRGWGGRASEAFTVSAVVTPDDRDAELRLQLDEINKRLGRDPHSVLHWSTNVKDHSDRKMVSSVLGASRAVFANVVTVKNSLIGTKTKLSDSTYQYNYAIRRLLERISWYVDEAKGEAIITFAHVRRFPYHKLEDYVSTLKVTGTQIRWQAIRSYGIDQPSNIRLLQMADCAVGCVTAAVRRDSHGACEPTYLMNLAPAIYVRPGGHVLSYGFNVVGARDCMNEYDWWPAFREVCKAA